MKNKTLKQKISLTLFGTVVFFAFLFALGFVLKTEIISRSPTANEVYEIGRDALTLTAYFLAPVTALILFSDWRLEHVEKSREEQGKEIYNLVKQVDSQIHDFHMDVVDEENYSEVQSKYMENNFKEILNNIFKLEALLNEFEFDDANAIAFKSMVKQILDIQLETYMYVERMYSSVIKANDIATYKTLYTNDTDEEFLAEQQKNYDEAEGYVQENFHKKYPLLQELKPLKNSIKVKVESPN
jgi:hypothetical protein